ncbi:MAG: hypothetical protein NTV28_10650 [Propionibacteriales bacterium]|nr:hypothetical protein [Propionibacteriales bacterium]
MATQEGPRRRSWRDRTNRAVHGATARVDGQTEDAARRAVTVIVPTVRLLRVPSLVLVLAPLPFLVATVVLGLAAGGTTGTVLAVVALVVALAPAAFAVRRLRLLRAVEEPEQLATELGIAVSLSDKVEEARGALTSIAGGGGLRFVSRLKGVWSGVGMTGRWIEGVDDLPRARWFVPPKIGTTVSITIATLWSVPISALLAFFTAVAAIAGSL